MREVIGSAYFDLQRAQRGIEATMKQCATIPGASEIMAHATGALYLATMAQAALQNVLAAIERAETLAAQQSATTREGEIVP